MARNSTRNTQPQTDTTEKLAEKVFDMNKGQTIEDMDFDAILSDFGMEQAEIGFPPYWPAEEGRYFYATMMGIDDNDPEFERVVLKALAPVKCQRGPNDDQAEEVIVRPGQKFTMSVYAGIIVELKEAVGLDVLLKVTGTRKMKDPKKNDMFTWSLHLPPAHHRELLERREAAMRLFDQEAAAQVPQNV